MAAAMQITEENIEDVKEMFVQHERPYEYWDLILEPGMEPYYVIMDPELKSVVYVVREVFLRSCYEFTEPEDPTQFVPVKILVR